MVRKLIPDANSFKLGMTRIERNPGESQAQFDATKDTATFELSGQTHTLVLDGKLDDVLAQGVHAWHEGESLITDLRHFSGKAEAIAKVCKDSEELGNTAIIDLGTGVEWMALPNYRPDDHTVYGYQLLSGPGPQQINVSLREDGINLVVETRDKQRNIHHANRGVIGYDGSVTPNAEGVTWNMAR